MRVRLQLWLPILVVATTVAVSAGGQDLSPQSSGLADGSMLLLTFKDSDIKFRLQSLMEILRDHQHEGWVLAAYPDPNTGNR